MKKYKVTYCTNVSEEATATIKAKNKNDALMDLIKEVSSKDVKEVTIVINKKR